MFDNVDNISFGDISEENILFHGSNFVAIISWSCVVHALSHIDTIEFCRDTPMLVKKLQNEFDISFLSIVIWPFILKDFLLVLALFFM